MGLPFRFEIWAFAVALRHAATPRRAKFAVLHLQREGLRSGFEVNYLRWEREKSSPVWTGAESIARKAF